MRVNTFFNKITWLTWFLSYFSIKDIARTNRISFQNLQHGSKEGNTFQKAFDHTHLSRQRYFLCAVRHTILFYFYPVILISCKKMYSSCLPLQHRSRTRKQWLVDWRTAVNCIKLIEYTFQNKKIINMITWWTGFLSYFSVKPIAKANKYWQATFPCVTIFCQLLNHAKFTEKQKLSITLIVQMTIWTVQSLPV